MKAAHSQAQATTGRAGTPSTIKPASDNGRAFALAPNGSRGAPPSDAPESPGSASGGAAVPPAPESTDAVQLAMLSSLAQLPAGALSLGLGGSEFGEKIEYQHGAAVIDQIIATPQQELLAGLKAVPAVWSMLAPFEASLPQFIAELYAWAEEGGEPGGEGDATQALKETP